MKHTLPLLLALLGMTADARAADWSNWRGPEQNGVARDVNLPDKWTLIWQNNYGSRTTPIVQGGHVYTISRVGQGVTQQERVNCFDAETGNPLWEHRFNVFFTDIVAERLGWTNLVGDPETGNVYAHTTGGFLVCFSKDGKILWQHSVIEEYGRIAGYGGRVTSPIVDGDLLLLGLVNATWGQNAIGRNRFVAFDKKTGNVVWWASTGLPVKDTYYSVPIVAVVGGQRLLISGGGDGGVHAFKVRTGEKVWSHVLCNGAVNCSPVVSGDLIYIGHGEENKGSNTQGAVVCLDGSKVANGKPKVVWEEKGIKEKFASPVIHEGKLYVCDEAGRLYCLNAKNGEELWNYDYGKQTRGSPVLADGKIYVTEVDSKFHILKPTADGCDELHAQYFPPRPDGAIVQLNASPAVANGRIYVTSTVGLYCIGTKNGKAGTVPPPVKEAPVAKDAKPAHLQVYPGEVVLQPGESAELTARAFDDHGRLIGETKVTWSLAGMRPPEGAPSPAPGTSSPPPAPALLGELSAKEGTTTKVTVAKAPPGQFGRVVATLGDLTGSCRVRVAPRLPYSADFSKVPVGRTPGGWVNTQGKFSVIELKDGKKVLKKRNDAPSPLVARANAFIGLPSMRDYTIEADVQSTKVGDDLSDVGVVANRYVLQLSGNVQQVGIISWDAQKRVDKSIAFSWKPDVWYRLKLTVEVNGDKAMVKGKVWPRAEAEPKDWTIEFVDPAPNKEGAPALYGYSAGILPDRLGSEIYYDDVRVTPNKKN
jgi:outer membrane protein assembly factor BamB